MVVPLLGDVVVGAVAAGDAGEGELVVGVLDIWSLALALGGVADSRRLLAGLARNGTGDGVACASGLKIVRE